MYNSTETSNVKTRRKNNAEFIQTRALSQLSFVKFRPHATLFPRLLLTLTFKSKKAKRS